jgi:hypothetical protein
MQFFDEHQKAALKEMARQIVRQMPNSDKRKVKKQARLAVGIHINPHHAKMLRNNPPAYWTEAGLVQSSVHDIAVSQVNGETIAYYDLTYRSPSTGIVWSTRYIYAVRFGKLKELKKYEPRQIR